MEGLESFAKIFVLFLKAPGADPASQATSATLGLTCLAQEGSSRTEAFWNQCLQTMDYTGIWYP